jgi:fructose-1,6-bisphosphatase II / sedoheptulose-1,7-bisphosphatase
MMKGVQFGRSMIKTHTVIMRSSTKTVRWISTVHSGEFKFDDV